MIDGQQRLTTLQLLLDALHAEIHAAGVEQPAKRLEALVRNPDAFCDHHEDQFKVWPTNRDRAAFNDVMAATPPVAYGSLAHAGERLVQAHRYFSEQAREWLNSDGPEKVVARAEKLEHVVRELLQLVVIDLTAEENAQEIFETLNARGAGLTAADLIKNFVFQRLMEQDVDVEAAYEKYWKDFETGFWEVEVSFGRLRYSRSSIFLNHWLIARTGEETVAREVFTRFKRYADFDAGTSMLELVTQIARASKVYRAFIEGVTANNPVDRLQLFAYRSNTLESEVFKPVVLWLFDAEMDPVPSDQVTKALDVLESWLVRRMLVRATTKAYNQVAAELVTQLQNGDRENAGDVVEQFFTGQNVESRYWPDDDEVISELKNMPAYQRIRNNRLRMVLEAQEDHRRGWKGPNEGLGGERVARGMYHIEHVMPQKWQKHWPLEPDEDEATRDRLVHTAGNLTLVTSKLNTKLSNAPWDSKRVALQEHDVLKLNVGILLDAGAEWSVQKIRARTADMAQAIVEIWPVPEGHKSSYGKTAEQPKRRVTVADLIGAGLIEPGSKIFARRKAHSGRTAVILPDGRIDVDGHLFETPSGAARWISGKSENGWWFFNVGQTDNRALAEVFNEYLEQTSEEIDDEAAEQEIADNTDGQLEGSDDDA
ncbi:hypothetical protein AO501_23260 [Mycobacterium gordonae]|uniref:DUF262 domain-containing protein n=1 Tax=Mycobacterium gordonae TaxID=1778 RepID=A0A0Q2X4F9_MYCGO|nr:hypothetical protein AO501_23260 [Mycobacterium gordonae]